MQQLAGLRCLEVCARRAAPPAPANLPSPLTRIGHRQPAAADRGHRGGAVALGNRAFHSHSVGKRLLERDHRRQGALCAGQTQQSTASAWRRSGSVGRQRAAAERSGSARKRGRALQHCCAKGGSAAGNPAAADGPHRQGCRAQSRGARGRRPAPSPPRCSAGRSTGGRSAGTALPRRPSRPPAAQRPCNLRGPGTRTAGSGAAAGGTLDTSAARNTWGGGGCSDTLNVSARWLKVGK